MTDDPADDFVRAVTTSIAEIRRDKGITQAQAAERLGIAINNWQRIERGQNLTLKMLYRVAVALEVTPGELVGRGS